MSDEDFDPRPGMERSLTNNWALLDEHYTLLSASPELVSASADPTNAEARHYLHSQLSGMMRLYESTESFERCAFIKGLLDRHFGGVVIMDRAYPVEFNIRFLNDILSSITY